MANCRDKMYFLKAFGTFYTVFNEIFFRQTMNRYEEELLLFVFELCTLMGADWEKEKCLTEVCQSATHPHLHCNTPFPVSCLLIRACSSVSSHIIFVCDPQ